jgi:hypothetical protein
MSLTDHKPDKAVTVHHCLYKIDSYLITYYFSIYFIVGTRWWLPGTVTSGCLWTTYPWPRQLWTVRLTTQRCCLLTSGSTNRGNFFWNCKENYIFIFHLYIKNVFCWNTIFYYTLDNVFNTNRVKYVSLNTAFHI